MIEFHYQEVTIPAEVDTSILTACLIGLFHSEGYELDVVNVIFCSDDEILKINRTYLNHDYYTDIITFDYVEGSVVSGDLFISIDTVTHNAIKYDVSAAHELVRVVVHGCLHLCGLKDKNPVDQQLMRSKEDFYLSNYVSRET